MPTTFASAFKTTLAAETPAPATAPVATPAADQDPDMPIEIKSEKGRESWKTWKQKHSALETERDSIRTERDSIKAEIEKLKAAGPGNGEELGQLKTQLQDLQVQLRMKDIEADPEWQQTYVKPVKGLIEQAKAIVPEEMRKAVETALSISDPVERIEHLERIAENLSNARTAQLGALAGQIAQIQSAAENRKSDQKTLVSDYEKALAARQQREAQHQMQQVQQQIEQIRQSKFSSNEVFKDPLAAKEVNDLLLGQNDPTSLIEAAHFAAIGRRASEQISTFSKQVTDLQVENKSLQAQIAKLTGNRPKLGDAQPSSGADAAGQERTFTSVFGRAIRGET